MLKCGTLLGGAQWRSRPAMDTKSARENVTLVDCVTCTFHKHCATIPPRIRARSLWHRNDSCCSGVQICRYTYPHSLLPMHRLDPLLLERGFLLPLVIGIRPCPVEDRHGHHDRNSRGVASNRRALLVTAESTAAVLSCDPDIGPASCRIWCPDRSLNCFPLALDWTGSFDDSLVLCITQLRLAIRISILASRRCLGCDVGHIGYRKPSWHCISL